MKDRRLALPRSSSFNNRYKLLHVPLSNRRISFDEDVPSDGTKGLSVNNSLYF
jgi:hypothetical protein